MRTSRYTHFIRIALVVSLVGTFAPMSCASELIGYGGTMEDSNSNEQSYAWGLEYFQGLGENLAFSIGYLNEGHVPHHHRDGQSLMLWARTNLLDRRLSLSAGAGSYYYYDTTNADTPDYHNNHDFGLMTSLAATWYTDSRLLFQVRANTIYARRNFDTHTLLLGIGYQLDPPDKPGPLTTAPAQEKKTTDNEIAVYLGKTIVNSFTSEGSAAICIEYRRGLMKYLDASVAWMNEGKTEVMRRNGIITELWLTRAFLNEKLALAYGLGGYFAVDKRKGESRGGTNSVASALNTLSISYRVTPTWVARVHWNRMITGYDRDADVIMGGIGYRF